MKFHVSLVLDLLVPQSSGDSVSLASVSNTEEESISLVVVYEVLRFF